MRRLFISARQIMMLLFTFLMAATFMLTTGCVMKSEKKEVVKEVEPASPVIKEKEKEVIIKEIEQPPMPPAPQLEVRGIAPSPTHVWTPGYWEWDGRDWVWVNGKWIELSSPEAVWMPGHWEWNGRNWIWVSGYWRQ